MKKLSNTELTDYAIHQRQLASRRVTVTARRIPNLVRLNTARRLVTNANEK